MDDRWGRSCSVTQNTKNAQIHFTRYLRNELGQVESIEDALGQRETFRYDLRGQLIEKLDKDGFLTNYGYTAHGDLAKVQYADGREVKLSYNSLRQLTEVTDWLARTQIELDSLGRAIKVTDHQDRTVQYAYGKGGVRQEYSL